ncbi:GNAT family N-acetyltransferase [Fusobacterium sp. MFO224]|uniref:GNAT family N-acetyltransferase n=1 Tax=Fusobacterium sp. MFO224 TaxID=3378070 RepID=UPI003853FF85
MIRKLKKIDIDRVSEIWLNANLRAHNFIPKSYWKDNLKLLKKMLPESEVYVYGSDNEIQGFIGIMDNYIAGIFVSEKYQSRGIGKQLLDFIKSIKRELNLNVYEKNIRALRFYKRENFKIKSKKIDEATGENEYLLEWK